MLEATSVLQRYRRTFGRAVAIVYTGGTVAQLLHLLLRFGWEYMPFWVDWVLIVVGTYGGLGLLIFARRVAWRGTMSSSPRSPANTAISLRFTSGCLHGGRAR